MGIAYRVLVVEDEPDISALVAYHLTRGGLQVDTASEDERIRGFELGADASLVLDTDALRVFVGDREVPLTPTEFKLLHALIEHPKKVCSRSALLKRVWEFDPETANRVRTRTVEGIR